MNETDSMSVAHSQLTAEGLQEVLRLHGLSELAVEVFDSLPSTSEYLMGLAHESLRDSKLASTLAARPQVCAADWQTKGSGRRGKTWVTERGNVTFSMLLTMDKPPSELLGLSLVTGLCVAESLAALADVSVQLKWPNDVLVDDKKLCGLLTELVSSSKGVTQVCVGIGINYTQPDTIDGCDYEVASLPILSKAPPSRETLIGDITARLLEAYALFMEHGWPMFADRWHAVDYLNGKQVRIINADKVEHAVAAGVDSNGALLVESEGVTKVVYSGDVSVRVA